MRIGLKSHTRALRTVARLTVAAASLASMTALGAVNAQPAAAIPGLPTVLPGILPGVLPGVNLLPTAQDSTVSVTTSSGGLRSAGVHRPPGGTASSVLMVVLHGGTGTGAQAKTDYHWATIADQYGFAAAFPGGGGGSWNAGDCCGTARSTAAKDVEFLDLLVAKLKDNGTITANATIYASGISNGGMMAYRWACEGSTAVTGIGIVSGSRQIPTCNASRTSKVVAIHGTADANIPEDGDQAKRTKALTVAETRSVNASVVPFLTARGCNGTSAPVGTPAYNLPAPTVSTPSGAAAPVGNGIVTTSTWSPCTNGGLVEKFVITDGGHSWPCSEPPASANSPYDQPSHAMSASLTLVNELGLGNVGTKGVPVPCTTL